MIIAEAALAVNIVFMEDAMSVATAFVIKDWGQYTKREAVTNDCVDVKRTYIHITRDLTSGVMLSQIAYWWLPREDGKAKLWVKKRGFYWLPMKHSDWAEFEIGEWAAAAGLKHLKELGIIETKVFRFMGAPTTHIRLLKKSLVLAVEQTLNENEHLRQLWDVEIEPDDPTPTPPQPDLPYPSPEPVSDEITGEPPVSVLEDPQAEDVNQQVENEPVTLPETPTNPDVEGIPDTPRLESVENRGSVIKDSLEDSKNNNTQAPEQVEIPSQPNDDVAVDDKYFKEGQETTQD